MLNIKFYRGVILDKSYKNVLYLENKLQFDNYLNTFYVNEINGIAVRFDGKNSITLPKFYENCNYMRIEDTNAVETVKYYYINNYEFVSTNVKYYISCDIWHTYCHKIDFYRKCLLLQGHADAINATEGIFKEKSIIKSNEVIYNDAYKQFGNTLINPQDIYSSAGAINIEIATFIKTNNGVQLLTSGNLYYMSNVSQYLEKLYQNVYYDLNEDDAYTYEILHTYVIPDVEGTEVFNNFMQSYKTVSFSSNTGASIGTSSRLFNMYSYGTITYRNRIVTSFVLKEKAMFKTINNTYATRVNKAKKKFFIGTRNNYKELDNSYNAIENGIEMRLRVNVFETFSLQILLEYGDNIIDLTSSFELPVNNDSYNLYMNTNKQQIDTANKTNYLNYLMSVAGIVAGVALAPATAGASSVLAGAGVATATASLISKEMQSNARLKDAYNSFDRLDNTLTNLAIMLLYGVGVFEVNYNDDYLEDTYNYFGTTNQTYTSNILYNAVDRNTYNFYYIQLQNAYLSGEFNEDVRQTLKNIFESGVRIYLNRSYIYNSNYKN